MTRVSDLHEKWMRDPKYRAAYEELRPEFQSVRAAARERPGPKQPASRRKKPLDCPGGESR